MSETTATARERQAYSDTVMRIGRSRLTVILLAFLIAFVFGSLLILISDQDVREASQYFFARPMDTIVAGWQAISQAYIAMFRGAVFDFQATSFSAAIRPLTETLAVATPLIIAASGIAVAFRAGLFNIGAAGQLTVGAIVAGYIGFSWDLPPVIHLLVAIIGGILAGAIWGGISGFLKARFEANEVITTIMLNWVATYLLFWGLKTPLLTGANSNQPTSPSVMDTAQLPPLLGSQFRVNLGLLVAVLAVVFLWWLMNRSTLGFRFRAVGSNPRAAQVAGISIARSSFGVMMVAGALVGLAGAVHVLGTERRLTEGISGNIGFDAITVALLGASGPLGILLAGLLFAALSTGGRFMETTQGVPIDLVQVIQALVVLFIAAPPLVRYLVGLRRIDDPTAGQRRKRRKADAKAGSLAGPGETAAAGTAVRTKGENA